MQHLNFSIYNNSTCTCEHTSSNLELFRLTKNKVKLKQEYLELKMSPFLAHDLHNHLRYVKKYYGEKCDIRNVALHGYTVCINIYISKTPLNNALTVHYLSSLSKILS